MTAMSPHARIDLPFRVLLYSERGEYVAHAIELDLIGAGASPNKALADLRNAVEAQITFAMQMNDPALLHFPAPADVAARWDEAFSARLHDLATGDVPLKFRCVATFMEISASEVEELRRLAGHSAFTPELAHA